MKASAQIGSNLALTQFRLKIVSWRFEKTLITVPFNSDTATMDKNNLSHLLDCTEYSWRHALLFGGCASSLWEVRYKKTLLFKSPGRERTPKVRMVSTKVAAFQFYLLSRKYQGSENELRIFLEYLLRKRNIRYPMMAKKAHRFEIYVWVMVQCKINFDW